MLHLDVETKKKNAPTKEKTASKYHTHSESKKATERAEKLLTNSKKKPTRQRYNNNNEPSEATEDARAGQELLLKKKRLLGPRASKEALIVTTGTLLPTMLMCRNLLEKKPIQRRNWPKLT